VMPPSAQQSESMSHGSPGAAKHVDWQTPDGEHDWPAAQVPHDPVPQLLRPQLRPAQVGTHVGVQVPRTESHARLPVHAPHVPPQPSGPQLRPAQLGVQHVPFIGLQLPPPGQVPHEPPQPSGPQARPPQRGWHVITAAQVPPALHVCPIGHAPHVPPQPLSPQVRPAQFGMHVPASGVPVGWHPMHAPRPVPALLHVCTPLELPAHAHATVAPGVHTCIVPPSGSGG